MKGYGVHMKTYQATRGIVSAEIYTGSHVACWLFIRSPIVGFTVKFPALVKMSEMSVRLVGGLDLLQAHLWFFVGFVKNDWFLKGYKMSYGHLISASISTVSSRSLVFLPGSRHEIASQLIYEAFIYIWRLHIYEAFIYMKASYI